MDDKKSYQPHNLVLEDRKHLVISGIKDVDSFDEQTIIADSTFGQISIIGSNLKINRFNAEIGELAIDGDIDTIGYADNQQERGGFFGRIFR